MFGRKRGNRKIEEHAGGTNFECENVFLLLSLSRNSKIANVDSFRANNQIDIRVIAPRNIDQRDRLAADSARP